MIQLIQRLLARKDETGASAVEYGLLVAGIAAIIVTAVFALGGFIDGMFNGTVEDIQNGGDAAPVISLVR